MVATLNNVLYKMGPWHVPTLAFLFFRGFPLCFTILFLSFAAPKMDHWCARPAGFQEWTSEQWRNFAIPLEVHKGKLRLSQCRMYRIEATNQNLVALNETVSCTAWEYDRSFYKSNVVTEWDLVCDRSWYISMSQSILMAGIIVGNILFATLSDRFGRRISLILGVILLIVSSLICVASPTFLVFNIIRLVSSLGIGAYQGTAVTIAMECISPKRRPLLLLGALGWMAGCLALPWLAYALTDWVILQVVFALSNVVLLALWFFVPESPRWLLTKGKLEKAEVALKTVVIKNKVKNLDIKDIIEQQRKLVNKSSNAEHKPTFFDLFRGRKLRKNTILIFISYFVNRLLMFHLTFFSVELGGSPFVSFTLVILFSLPGCSIVPLLMIRYCRRRIALAISCFVTGAFILLLIPFSEEHLIMRLLATIIAKNAVNAGAGVLTVFAGEVFPTVVRNLGIGGGYMVSRTGAMLAPFFKELASTTSPTVAASVSAAVALIGGVAAIILPETLERPLPDTLEDAERQT